MNRYPYFTPSNYHQFIEDVKRHLSRDEPGVIISYPASGISWRAEQLVQDYSQEFDHEVTLLTLSEKAEIEDLLTRIQDKHAVIVTNTEFAFDHGATDQINALIAYQRKRHHDLRLLFLSEKNIFEPTYKKLITQSTFFANSSYYPLYPPHISKDFLTHMMMRWEIKMSMEDQSAIVKECGGSIWLIKHVLRLVMNHPDVEIRTLLQDPTMKFRLETMYQGFTAQEQEDLTRIVQQGSESGASDLNSHYFDTIGLIARGRITIPLFAAYIQSRLEKHTIKVSGNEITVNNIHVNDVFSEQERAIFILLFQNAGTNVEREQIAEALWKDDIDEKYSPWAIEQLIKRLRKKLTNLGLPKQSIKTVRGKGYMFSDNT